MITDINAARRGGIQRVFGLIPLHILPARMHGELTVVRRRDAFRVQNCIVGSVAVVIVVVIL